MKRKICDNDWKRIIESKNALALHLKTWCSIKIKAKANALESFEWSI